MKGVTVTGTARDHSHFLIFGRRKWVWIAAENLMATSAWLKIVQLMQRLGNKYRKCDLFILSYPVDDIFIF